MKYAVIQIQGHQHKVREGEEFLVDKTEKPEVKVLLYVDEDKVLVGQPEVANAKIEIKVLEQIKGEKIDVYKFKAKSNYRRHIGFRPLMTRVKIEEIRLDDGKKVAADKKIKIQKSEIKAKRKTKK